jgi:hypothetical protein
MKTFTALKGHAFVHLEFRIKLIFLILGYWSLHFIMNTIQSIRPNLSSLKHLTP